MNTKDIQEQEKSSLKNSLPSQKRQHNPVLLQEIIESLPLFLGGIVIDATLGLGGHAKAMQEKIGKTGKIIAFDWDNRNRILAKKNLIDYPNITIVPKGFSHLLEECKKRGVKGVDAILFDLGISSQHLDDATRGFSYRLDGPLDMRMDMNKKENATDIINSYSEEELADMFYRYGEEKRSRHIARKIIEVRKKEKIYRTSDLFKIIEEVCDRNPKKSASRVFQALRIVVNDELKEIESAIPQAFQLLNPGGKIAVISFHSLEDRIVKTLFREKEQKEKVGKTKVWQRVNKKVIIPKNNEIADNPRSRSAKLRIIERIIPVTSS